nr:hypothetical protein [Bradyrhizobium sp.]
MQFDEQGRPGQSQNVGGALQNHHLGTLDIDLDQAWHARAFVLNQMVQPYSFDGDPGAVPGKFVVRWVKVIDLEEHWAGGRGSNSLQRTDPAGQALALQRRDERFVVAIFRLDRDDLAAGAYLSREAEREEPDIGSDIDDHRSLRDKFLKSFNRPGFEMPLVARIEHEKDPVKHRQAVDAELRSPSKQLHREISDQALEHLRRSQRCGFGARQRPWRMDITYLGEPVHMSRLPTSGCADCRIYTARPLG